jgi:thioredoxin reductase (NADPH)
MGMVRDVVIVGSGPAGCTAAIYAARAGRRPLVVASSVEAGGELMKTTEIENFPGFPDGLQGPELMGRMQAQAERFGAEFVYDDVATLDLRGDVKTVTLGSGTVERAHAVVITTGSAYRKLGVAGEKRLSGHGISWCATCDGFFFKNREIAVVGGGDSAMEEATFLTRFASKVWVVHRGSTLRASRIMQERALANDKIEFLWNKRVVGFTGDEAVTGLDLLDTVDGSRGRLPVGGVFEAIGNDPRVHLVHGQLDLTEHGTIRVDGRSSRTSLPGVFAAGDVIDPSYRQAITAAGSGATAALDVEHFLESAHAGSAPVATAEPEAVLAAG